MGVALTDGEAPRARVIGARRLHRSVLLWSRTRLPEVLEAVFFGHPTGEPTIGIDLDLEESEYPVGRFSLDLVGRDLTNDAVSTD